MEDVEDDEEQPDGGQGTIGWRATREWNNRWTTAREDKEQPMDDGEGREQPMDDDEGREQPDGGRGKGTTYG